MSGSVNKGKEQNRSWWYLGVLGMTLITKYKTIVPLLAKFAVPVGSMLASVLAYAWVTRNWVIGLGIVSMIFIHEIGHVLAAKRRGLPVTLPLFIPFLGAFIMMKKNPRDAVTEAYIAIGGPVLGTAGALFVFVLGIAYENITLLVVAYIGFFLNLINLMPIHPLDGGRIAVAVTRWLWLVGLVGGLWFIWYLQSFIFFIIYVLFVWELYSKYVRKRNGNMFTLPLQLNIPAEYLRMLGVLSPNEEEQHKDLAFTTYSDRNNGNQTVEVFWDSLGVREKITLQRQCLVHRVRVVRIKHLPDNGSPVTHIVAHCELTGSAHENDKYYEVPKSDRWTYGFAYLGLAVFLIFLMMKIHEMGIPGVRG